MNEPKLRKGQKCFMCKKIIKGSWCWNGHYYDDKCFDKFTSRRIGDYLGKITNK
jgi:hypothetical protein